MVWGSAPSLFVERRCLQGALFAAIEVIDKSCNQLNYRSSG
jgi:hypothetical protein